MSNRSGTAPSAALDARRVIAVELRERVRDVLPAPFDWAGFDAGALRGAGAALDARLAAMQRLLCASPARSAELRGLWNESVITAAYASRIAPDLGSEADTAATA